MRRSTFHRLTWPGLALGALATAAGCNGDRLTSALHPSGSLNAIASSGVMTTQLRAFPGETPYAWGPLQLTMGGTAADPCRSAPTAPTEGTTTIALCGIIFQKGGATFTGSGGIYHRSSVELDASLLLVASFAVATPLTSPCRRYDVQGTIAVSGDVATDIVTSPADYVVVFEGLHPPSPIFPPGPPVRLLGGSLDGQAWGPIGDIPSTDAYFTENRCDLGLAPSP